MARRLDEVPQIVAHDGSETFIATRRQRDGAISCGQGVECVRANSDRGCTRAFIVGRKDHRVHLHIVNEPIVILRIDHAAEAHAELVVFRGRRKRVLP